MAPPRIPLETRLLRWTDLDLDTGCWMWTGKLDHSGYAHIKWRGKDQKTATVVFEFYKGPIPAGLEVSHICPGGGNPACVNPDHLIAETHSENLKRRRSYRWVINCPHCGQPKEQVKSGDRSEWVCKPCRAQRAKQWRDKTGYDFNAYRAENRDRINANRRMSRATKREFN